jgi:RimJ/RimL family protein N-acetyltransferase
MSTEAEAPILTIVGERVALGPIRKDLVPLYVRWVNDFEVTRTLGIGCRPMTLEAELAWYEGAAKGESGSAIFTIYERESMRPIGNTDLHDISHFHRTAEFGLMIGAKDLWGRGYGTETARLMLDYGFHGLGLHNVMLRAFSHNERGLRAYRRAGFREFGRLREAHRIGGRTVDVVYMDCLATEFESPVLKRIIEGATGQ